MPRINKSQLKTLTVLLSWYLATIAHSQPGQWKNRTNDTGKLGQMNLIAEDIPVLLMNENDRSENSSSYVPPLLTANKDAFYSAANFQFRVTRFRIKGYDGAFFPVYLNGLPMNDLEDGNAPWSLWGGLNDVLRNTVISQGLRNNDFSFGALGNSIYIDARASKQRKQTQMGYTASNRAYIHKWMFTYNTGMQKNNWALSFCGSRRMAEEGNVPGTFYDGWSYFISVDKQLNAKNLLSVVLFGAPLTNGRQAPVLEESVNILGKNYNPYWGYQSGKKRNANIGSINRPVCILQHDIRINNNTRLISALGYMSGNKISTGLDWYKAADPRPDYYRYLPSFQTDPLLQQQSVSALKKDIQLQQINWQKMYDINRTSLETVEDADGISGNNVTGQRSHYIIEDRINALQRINFYSVLNTSINQYLALSVGLNAQMQSNHYYKRINDLLGGAFYVNWNQFAENDFPNNTIALQNDLNHPDEILLQGDRFGYDYTMHYRYRSLWIQTVLTKNRLDAFAAASYAGSTYWRNGHVRNGLFPGNSFGISYPDKFNDYAFKTGFTYKFNGRKYTYLHIGFMTKAPLIDNIFISPKTRDTKQKDLVSEGIKAAEMGYVLNAPKLRFRISGYAAQFDNGMNVLTFYHDEYRTLVNYTISNIDKVHYGIETGAEIKLSARWSANTAITIGRYYFNSRQNVSVSLDNDAYIIAKELIYSKNFRVPGTPQEAYSLEMRYQSPSYFFLTITGNYFNQQWLDYNPVRRSYSALQGVTENSEQWNSIIHQTMLSPLFLMNIFAGTSWQLRASSKSSITKTLLCNMSINNLLNNQNVISGGYEQLRFDMAFKDVNKFPSKLFYANGISFSAGLTLRF